MTLLRQGYGGRDVGRGEGGEFFGGDEPYFKGAVQDEVPWERHIGQTPFDGVFESEVVLGRGSRLEGQEGLQNGFGEGVGAGDGRGQGMEVIILVGFIGRRHGKVDGFEFGSEGAEEYAEAAGADALEEAGLDKKLKVCHSR